jgi:hypothetical protein
MDLGRPHQAALILQDISGADFVAVDLHGDLASKNGAETNSLGTATQPKGRSNPSPAL